jgi:Uma2 family endonuclease
MGPVTLLPVRHDGWTIDDLDNLPDDGLRYELVDGTLLVSPPPTVGHNSAAFELGVLLKSALDDSWRVVPAPGVVVDRRNYREPDLVVLRRVALTASRASAHDVLLAVEVMSPSSITNDRLVKPALYARAGIPHYWRLERETEPVLITHALDGDAYRETARFLDDVVIGEPARLRFRLAELFA